MKKLFTITCSILLFLFASGQKDVEMKLLSPSNNSTLYVNEAFAITYSLKNVGSELINADDSFFINLKIDGDYLQGSFYKKLQLHSNIPPGDSVFYTTLFTYTYAQPTPFSYCLELVTSKNGSAIDTNYINNQSCAVLKVLDRNTAGIAGYSNGKAAITIYPNPATNTVTIKINNPAASKAILTDINGREVVALQLHNGIANYNVSQLKNGLYIWQLWDKENNYLSTEKLMVSH